MQAQAMNPIEQHNQRNQSGTQKRAAIYARVSTIEQAEEGYSIDEQINVLREFCDREGYTIHKEYIDRGISGKNIKGRPAIQQLLHDANQKCFDIVIVWKMNRLSRTSVDLLTMVDTFQKKGISFRSFTERYETESPSGRLQFQMMAAIAEFERANIAENVKMGMIARAKEGSWNGGQVLGYDVVSVPSDNRKGKSSKLIVNEQEAVIVRKIFKLYVQGNGYKSIANQLNKEGYKTKKNKAFSINGIKTILGNPIYAGFIRYNVRRDWNEKRRNNINPNPIITKGQHEPIISETLWEQAKTIMKSRTGKPNRIHSGEFPLTGILRCPMCGAGMVLGRTTNRKKDGSKRVLEYYVCGAWKNKGTAVCHSNGIRTEYADEYVLQKLAGLASNDVLIKQIVDRINQKNQDGIIPLQKEYEVLKKSLSAIQSKKDKYLKLYVDELINKGELTGQLANLEQEKERLEEQIYPIEEQLGQGGVPTVNYDVVKEIMMNFMTAYKRSLTPEQRKKLLHLLIHKITISEDRKIDTIQIQLNKEVAKNFTFNGGANSSITDEFAPPFSIFINV
ncbi:recombinase family protein [Virgibacillus halodenitrificans]|uniref:recombinase family protein n=1 Tax=Virgibacillus halodenitrificans TaxID=1482 RepID=UPI001F3A527B|nr:recombinase family protein [Virgibacillus halodenitrificans]MCG1027623.1 recombinase family protein [Virgibacillus halodenitrificans]